jgi:hypothetical protein
VPKFDRPGLATPLVIRFATVHLVAVVLLVCPYLCLPGFSSAAGEASGCSESEEECDCYRQPTQADRDNCPCQPTPRQGCGSCLCRGAIMDRHVDAPAPDYSVVSFLLADTGFPAGEFSDGTGFSTHRAGGSHPTAETGREVRALIASLLL